MAWVRRGRVEVTGSGDRSDVRDGVAIVGDSEDHPRGLPKKAVRLTRSSHWAPVGLENRGSSPLLRMATPRVLSF